MTHPGEILSFRRPDGGDSQVVVVRRQDDPSPPEPPLRSRRLTIEYADGTREEVRQLTTGDPGPGAGYRALDNEILAGLRLCRLCGSRPYPPAVSRLVGYEADGIGPYALLEPHRGSPFGGSTRGILPSERVRFQESLLTGLRWLGAAGIAHRAICPETVYWDGTNVQITDFTAATLIGAPRSALGAPPWQPPEQRPDKATGLVSEKDDVWAAGRLIFYVTTGRDLAGSRQLDEEPELAHLLANVFGPPEGRPTVRELLGRLNLADPVPRPPAPNAAFQRGEADFFTLRTHKHPETAAKREPEPPVTATPTRPEPGRRRRRRSR
jgi:serine/threonine protein kinase